MSKTSPKGMTVRTLGTGGGPIVSSGRAGTSTAVTVDGATYVVDCGMGSIRNYRNECSWGELRGIFLTHQHSDHIYDLGSFLVTGWEVPGESFTRPVHVFGPGRPSRPPAMDEVQSRAIAARLGTRRMTGTVEVVDALLDTVFASDVAVRMADEGRGDPHGWINAHDIVIPEEAGADPVTARHPGMDPFEIYRDEHVVVTAILVDHRLCFPAFGFRIDSDYGSVVISGDTAYSENCVRLAEGADLLLHEVIDLDAIVATFPEGPARAGIIEHLKESHTPYDQVGLVAQSAGVRALVLHHVVPNTPGAADLEKMLLAVRADFAGPVAIAEDNDAFTVGADFPIISRLTMKTGAML